MFSGFDYTIHQRDGRTDGHRTTASNSYDNWHIGVVREVEIRSGLRKNGEFFTFTGRVNKKMLK